MHTTVYQYIAHRVGITTVLNTISVPQALTHTDITTSLPRPL